MLRGQIEQSYNQPVAIIPSKIYSDDVQGVPLSLRDQRVWVMSGFHSNAHNSS